MNASFRLLSRVAVALATSAVVASVPSVSHAEDAPSAVAPSALAPRSAAPAWTPGLRPGVDAPATHMRSRSLFGFGLGLTTIGATSIVLGIASLSANDPTAKCERDVAAGRNCTGLADPLAGLEVGLIIAGATQLIGGTTMAILGGSTSKESAASVVPSASVGSRSMSLRWVF